MIINLTTTFHACSAPESYAYQLSEGAEARAPSLRRSVRLKERISKTAATVRAPEKL